MGSIQGGLPLSGGNENPDDHDHDDDDDEDERHKGHREMLVVCDNPYPYYAGHVFFFILLMSV